MMILKIIIIALCSGFTFTTGLLIKPTISRSISQMTRYQSRYLSLGTYDLHGDIFLKSTDRDSSESSNNTNDSEPLFFGGRDFFSRKKIASLNQRMKELGPSAIITYGLFNCLYYCSATCFAWYLTSADVTSSLITMKKEQSSKKLIAYTAARLAKVMMVVWAGSQVNNSYKPYKSYTKNRIVRLRFDIS